MIAPLPPGLPKSILADFERAEALGPGAGDALYAKASAAAFRHLAAEARHQRERHAEAERRRYLTRRRA